MGKRLGKLLLYTYGVPDLFFGLLIAMEMYFFPLFLTDYVQFSILLTGQILWITGLLDMACTLGGGILLQKTELKFGGKYRSWFLAGPAIAVPLFVLQFTKIGNDRLAAVIIIIGFVASHLLFNVIYAAGGVMVGRISQRQDEITLMSASRAQGMSASGIVFSATSLPMIMFFGRHTSNIFGHTLAVIIYAILMIAGYWYLYRMTSGMDPYDKIMPDNVTKKSPYTIREIAALMFRNPPLLFLVLAETSRNTYLFIVMGFAVYYFKYVLNNMAFVSIFILANSISGLIGTFAGSWIGVKLGKRSAYWSCLVLAGISFASARYWGGSAWGFTLIFCIASMFGMVAGSMSTALFTDSGIYGEWKSGRDIRAFIMAVGNLPIKTGVFIRSAVFSLGLTAIGFVANTKPSPSAASGILSIMTLAPAAACLLAAGIFYFGCRLEDSEILRMQQEIANRKTAAEVH
jgi:Na+/melibiose symporter-like transporter